MYEVVLTKRAERELREFKRERSAAFYRKIERLLHQLEESPTEGIGQPERLRYEFSGCWSVRIDQQHRIVYEIHEEEVLVLVLSMKGHYPRG